MNRNETFSQLIPKKFSHWKKLYTWTLLFGEKITPKNIQHCSDLKLKGKCECNFHKGRFQTIFLVYIQPVFMGEGILEEQWIKVQRKDEILDTLKYYLQPEYDAEEFEIELKKKLDILNMIIFSDWEYIQFSELHNEIEELNLKAKSISRDVLKSKVLKTIEFIDDLIKNLKRNRAKLLGLIQFKEHILEEVTKFDSKDYEIWNFQDNFHIDFPFIPIGY